MPFVVGRGGEGTSTGESVVFLLYPGNFELALIDGYTCLVLLHREHVSVSDTYGPGLVSQVNMKGLLVAYYGVSKVIPSET